MTPKKKKRKLSRINNADDGEGTPSAIGENEDDQHVMDSTFTVNNCEEIGSSRSKKAMVRCKTCGMEVLRFSFFRHYRDQHSKRYKCGFCCFGSNSLDALTAHVDTHSRLIECEEEGCDEKFKYRIDYIEHMQRVHSSPPDLLECRHCGEKFVDQNAINHHQLSHAEVFPHKCTLCDKAFKMSSSLSTHMLSHEEVRPYACKSCPRSFTRKDKLRVHELKHHHEDEEENSEEINNYYVTHQTCEHFERNLGGPVELVTCHICGSVCHSCGIVFETRKLARSHTHENLCTVCGRKSLHRKAHLAHQRYHAAPTRLKCDECQLGFPKLLSFDLHNKRRHGIPVPKRKSDDKDGTVNETLSEDDLVCSECNKAFSSKRKLGLHMKEHLGRSYQCMICDQQFKTKTLLGFHLARHNGDKPHGCSRCDKAFVRKSDLYRHERTHEPAGEISCEVCGMEFKTQRNLKLHLKRHETKDNGVVCECGMKFLRKSHLKRHRRDVHGDEEKKPAPVRRSKRRKKEETSETSVAEGSQGPGQGKKRGTKRKTGPKKRQKRPANPEIEPDQFCLPQNRLPSSDEVSAQSKKAKRSRKASFKVAGNNRKKKLKANKAVSVTAPTEVVEL